MLEKIIKNPEKFLQDEEIILGEFGRAEKSVLSINVDSDGYKYILSHSEKGDFLYYPSYNQTMKSLFDDVVKDLA